MGAYALYLEVDSLLYDLELVWNNSHTAKEIPLRYEISLESNDDSLGEVFGTGLYYPDTALTLTAIAKEGCTFLGWEVDGEIVSEDERYAFVPTGDGVFLGVFVEN